MAEVALSADEAKWRAESDARSLAEAEVIKGDKERLEAAVAQAKLLAEESEENAESMRSVASVLFSDMTNDTKEE